MHTMIFRQSRAIGATCSDLGNDMGKYIHIYIHIAEWEEAAISKSSKSPLLYLRYLDDILIIWPHSKEEFWNFFEILN